MPTLLRPTAPAGALSRLALLAGLLALAACDSGGDDAFDVGDYVGQYSGTVTTTFRNGPTTTSTTAPLVVTVATPGASNVVTVTFDAGPAEAGGEDPAPATIPGTYSDTGARFAVADGANSFVFTVDEDGDIDGSGNSQFFGLGLTLSPSGRITGQQFDLDVDVVVAMGNADVPTGSTGLISIDAARLGR